MPSPESSFQRLRRRWQTDGSLKARLLRGGIGSAGVQAANRVLALGSGIVLARGLGVEGYGIYAYAFAVMGLLMILSEAGMPTLLLREVAASRERQDWGFLRGALKRGVVVVVTASILIMCLGLASLWFFRADLDSSRFYTLLLMLLILPVAATTKLLVSAIRGLHWVVIGQALEMLVQPALVLSSVVVLFVMWPAMREPEYVMLVQLATMSALLVGSAYVLSRLLPHGVRASAEIIPSVAWTRSAIPFTLIGGAAIINNHADIIMLGWFRSAGDVGVYRVTSQSAMLVGFLLQAAGAVAGPHFSTLYAQGNLTMIGRLLGKTALLASMGSVPILAVFLLWGSDVLAFVFGEPYRSGWLVLSILSIGYFVNVSFGPVGMLLQMIGKEGGTARVLWATAALNLVLNAVLIPLYGATGAAIATAISVSLYHAILRRLVSQSIGV